jgi:uncharacterized protein
MSVIRSLYSITVGGQNITSIVSPRLIDLTVTDKAGTHSDTASITIDDTNGTVRLPRVGDPVMISLGSTGSGFDLVFEGTVDEVKAKGDRGSGRTVCVTAKGLDTTQKAKEPQKQHFDEQTIQSILNTAGGQCGISVQCLDGLGGLKRKYLEMRDESFIHLGERIAREVGGNFRIKGKTAILKKRNTPGEGSVVAAWGVNLHSYDISPRLGRPQFNQTLSRWYDKEEAEWKEKQVGTSVRDGKAKYAARYVAPDEDEATQRCESDKATTERDQAEGTVTIELNPNAKPDGICIVATGKPGCDGSYLIESVSHRISRGSGGSTTLDLKYLSGG